MKTPSQPRAIYYIVAIQIWEYFSFYGMRALLILYLTHQLGFDDSHAISLFSAYASLVYVTPILGGWLADRLLGNRTAVIAGALLMTLGHVVLGVESDSTEPVPRAGDHYLRLRPVQIQHQLPAGRTLRR